MERFDALIIGGGPAGLSAALYLGRARRRVLICDDGAPRNRTVAHSHGFLTRDGASPAELSRLAWADVSAYPSVSRRSATVVTLERMEDGFRATLSDGGTVDARGVIVAAGVRDLLPPIPGLADTWGEGAFFCPYCHGWELRDQPLGLYGQGHYVEHMAFVARVWTDQLTIYADGPFTGSAEFRAKLDRNGIHVEETPVRGLVVEGRTLRGVRLADGRTAPCAGLLLKPPTQPASDLPDRLGIARTPEGVPVLDMMQQTSVPGVFLAGDINGGMPTLVTAIATGAGAAGGLGAMLAMQDADRR